MRNVVLYARDGIERTGKKLTELETQLNLLHDAATGKLQFNVIGAFGKRVHPQADDFPELNKAIGFAAQNDADLLILRPDRLGTDLVHLNRRVQLCRDMGMIIWFPNGDVLDAGSVTQFDRIDDEVLEARRQKMDARKEAARQGRLRYMEQNGLKRRTPR